MLDDNLSGKCEFLQQLVLAAQNTLPKGFDGQSPEQFDLCEGCGGIGYHKPDCWCVKLAELLNRLRFLISPTILADPNVHFAAVPAASTEPAE